MDLGRWGDGREMDEWNKERKKGKAKKECKSAQSKFERGVYDVVGDE